MWLKFTLKVLSTVFYCEYINRLLRLSTLIVHKECHKDESELLCEECTRFCEEPLGNITLITIQPDIKEFIEVEHTTCTSTQSALQYDSRSEFPCLKRTFLRGVKLHFKGHAGNIT